MAKAAKGSISDIASATFRKGEARPSVRPPDERLTPVTVRLDPARYRWLRMFGADQNMKHQTILVEALDLYRTNHERNSAA